MEIPKDKNYPEDSVQCHGCGGHGCPECDNRGWFRPATHPKGRRCYRDGCEKPIPPNYMAVYCTDVCFFLDADGDPPTPEQVKAISEKYGWSEEVTLEKILVAQRDLFVPTVQDAVAFLMETFVPPKRDSEGR